MTNNTNIAVLLSCIGLKTCSTLKNVIAPNLTGAKLLVELTGTLKGHFDPKPSLITQSLTFISNSNTQIATLLHILPISTKQPLVASLDYTGQHSLVFTFA